MENKLISNYFNSICCFDEELIHIWQYKNIENLSKIEQIVKTSSIIKNPRQNLGELMYSKINGKPRWHCGLGYKPRQKFA